MYPSVKRSLDVCFSLVGLLVLWPLFLLLALLIRLDSKGSPLFAQTRVGRYGEPFTLYKLRTMGMDTPHDVATSQLANAGMHITRIGKVLRKMSLDELPQLINVLRGDMSVVGPRPLVPGEGCIHEERMASGAYDVRPGITGWAQVNGRDKVNAGKKAQMDGYYAKHMSFSLDFLIVVKSAAYVLTGRGIQEGKVPLEEMEEREDREEMESLPAEEAFAKEERLSS